MLVVSDTRDIAMTVQAIIRRAAKLGLVPEQVRDAERERLAKCPAPLTSRCTVSDSLKPSNVWTHHNRRTIHTERLQAVAMGLAWVLAGMLAMTLLLTIARYALARAAYAATLAPSMMMF